jgi:glucose-1-phosphate thymidylyltransferase
MMKGIILAGGSGSRLYPLTSILTKQLQPIYDKPMIYYPLSILMLGNIKDILLIATASDLPHFKNLLGNGSHLGINLHYEIQKEPKGLPEAFTIGEKFIGDDDVTLILGDNLFHGNLNFFRQAIDDQLVKKSHLHARVFAYLVSDPERYGVVEFDTQTKRVLSMEEKPKNPKSRYAVPGLYIFDNTVAKRVRTIKPSTRGELEIIELIKTYLQDDVLGVEIINRGVAWLDTGTPQALLEASNYIAAIETRQARKVACLEEISYRMFFTNESQFIENINRLPKCPYRTYLELISAEIKGEIY